MTILERPVTDGIGIMENGITMNGVDSHAMDSATVEATKALALDEPQKDDLKVKVVEKEKVLHQKKSRDASQLFNLGDRTVIGE